MKIPESFEIHQNFC